MIPIFLKFVSINLAFAVRLSTTIRFSDWRKFSLLNISADIGIESANLVDQLLKSSNTVEVETVAVDEFLKKHEIKLVKNHFYKIPSYIIKSSFVIREPRVLVVFMLKLMVRPKGFEPLTFWSVVRCSIRWATSARFSKVRRRRDLNPRGGFTPLPLSRRVPWTGLGDASLST